jgi:hypothetical protein
LVVVVVVGLFILIGAIASAVGGGSSTSSGTSSSAPPSATATNSNPNSQASGEPEHADRHHVLVRVHDPGQVTGTLTGPCHTRRGGLLPDRRCTPGSFDPAVTAAVLCSAGYSTDSYRAPEAQTEQFKLQVAEPAYGQDNVDGELDHLVPLELAGSNDASNLWVEAGPIPNPKDDVENRLHDWVCLAGGTAGQHRLRRAQRAIATNWMTAEKVLGIGPATSTSAPPSAPPPAQPPAPSGCFPRTPSGHCYEPGEYCSEAEHGQSGIAGDGKRITCLVRGGVWRWE